MHPKYTPSPRTCADCAADISERRSDAQRCQTCTREFRLTRKRQPANVRSCVDCEIDITQRGHKAVRCLACGLAYRRAYSIQYGHEYYVTTRQKPYSPHLCRNCGVDITGRGHNRNAQWCAGCARNKERAYKQTSESKAIAKRYGDQLRATSEYKAKRQAYYARPETKELKSEYANRRRARHLAQMGQVSYRIKSLLKESQGNRCAFCKCSLKRKKAHLDHVVPLARGGLHDDSNLQILCSNCNHRKGAKDPIVFAQENGRLL